MPRLNGQLLVYLVVGAVILLVGLNSIRSEPEPAAFPTGGAGGAATGNESDQDGIRISGGSRKLTVDVAGAVRRPGVYRFSHGARVIDAIGRAGGATRRALLGSINRAATLTDGQQVVVPSAAPGGGPTGLASPETAAAPAPVSLGTATQGQLEEIDGIGPVTARKILEFRDSKGGLGSVDDLDQISGVGPVTMESLRAALTP